MFLCEVQVLLMCISRLVLNESLVFYAFVASILSKLLSFLINKIYCVLVWNFFKLIFLSAVFLFEAPLIFKMCRWVHQLHMMQQAWMSWGSGTKCTEKAVVEQKRRLDLGPDFDGSITNLSPMLLSKAIYRTWQRALDRFHLILFNGLCIC